MENTDLLYHCRFIPHEFRGNSRTIDTLSNRGRVKEKKTNYIVSDC